MMMLGKFVLDIMISRKAIYIWPYQLLDFYVFLTTNLMTLERFEDVTTI